MSEIDTSPEAVAAPMADLKPCPFCGGEARLRIDTAHSTAFLIGCATVGCFGHEQWEETEADAIAAWNARATPPEVTALVEAATALRDQIARWHAGGPVAGPEESRALFEALDAAITEWEAANA